jgi:hypothetical protein
MPSSVGLQKWVPSNKATGDSKLLVLYLTGSANLSPLLSDILPARISPVFGRGGQIGDIDFRSYSGSIKPSKSSAACGGGQVGKREASYATLRCNQLLKLAIGGAKRDVPSADLVAMAQGSSFQQNVVQLQACFLPRLKDSRGCQNMTNVRRMEASM